MSLNKHISRCPWCGKKATFLSLWSNKKNKRYKCENCKRDSEILLDSNLFKFAGFVILLASVITIIFSFIDAQFTILGVFFVLIIFIMFYISTPFFVSLYSINKGFNSKENK